MEALAAQVDAEGNRATDADRARLAGMRGYLHGLEGRSGLARTTETLQGVNTTLAQTATTGALVGANVTNASNIGRARSASVGYDVPGVGGGYGSSGSGDVLAGVSSGGGFGGGMGGVGDLTGTGFGIQSSGGDYREKARKLAAWLEQLKAAIAMGNYDAISTAITVIGMMSKTTLIQASLQVITAMQQYDDQMKNLSDQMGALNSRDPGYQGQLSELNSRFQSVNMGRQAIANTLRDVMGSNEEISTFEKSVYDVKSRSQANYARWT